jgi:hypothetical protein
MPMHRIANTTELQSELRRLIAYAESPQPSRERLAAALNDLSERVAASPPKVVFLEQDRWNYAYKLEGVKGGVPNHGVVKDFEASAKKDWISAKVRDGKKALAEVKRWIKSVNPSEFYVKWPADVDDDTLKVFYKKD